MNDEGGERFEMALTKEQALLLNNIMYDDGKPPFKGVANYENLTVADWVNGIDASLIVDDQEYGDFTTGKEWKEILSAIRADSDLMSMKIETTYTDSADKGNGGGGGFSAVFINEQTGDAAVVFRGTAGGEWADNFQGGNVTDTTCQKNALDWYKDQYQNLGLDKYEVTVTGHSKGGNKSKYITIMDDSVNHCFSFDGQGFSDKFYSKYSSEIEKNQGKIENHNADYDYVNILLNDVGKTTYYEGKNIGEGGFLENHCPNTLMEVDESGKVVMKESQNGQGPGMESIDEFFNSCLRSLPEDKRTDMLYFVNALVEAGLSIKGKTSDQISQTFLEKITDSKYADEASYLIAYLIKYEQENPEFAGQIRDFLKGVGLEGCVSYVNVVDKILNIDIRYGPFGMFRLDFKTLLGLFNLGVAGYALRHPLNWAMVSGLICDLLKKKFGIDMTPERLSTIMNMLGMVDFNLWTIKINKDGKDLKIDSKNPQKKNLRLADTGLTKGYGTQGKGCVINAIPGKMKSDAKTIKLIAERICVIADSACQSADMPQISTYGMSRIKQAIVRTGQSVNRLGDTVRIMSESLDDVAEMYGKTEENIVSAMQYGN